MSWQLRAAVRGNLGAYMRGMAEVVPRARTINVRRRVSFLKNRLRRDLVAVGLASSVTKGLPLAVRGTTMPARGFDFNPQGVVESKALKKRPGGIVDILQVFEHGAVIHGAHGSLLAIPTPAAGRTGRRPALPGDFGPGDLYFVRSHTNRSVGFLLRSSDDELMFVLVRDVRLRKLLNIAGRYQEAVAPLAELEAKEIEVQAAKILVKTAS